MKKQLIAAALAIGLFVGGAQSASAHHGFHGGGFHGGGFHGGYGIGHYGFGGYGFGSGFYRPTVWGWGRPYIGYYSYRPVYRPILLPRVYTYRSCYTPVYYSYPTYCPTYYSAPVYVVPSCSTTTISVGLPLASSTFSAPVASPSTRIASMPAKSWAAPTASNLAEKLVQQEGRPKSSVAFVNPGATLASTRMVEAPKKEMVVKALKPYSPAWTQSAVGLIDDMIAAGDLETANASCVRMESIRGEKDAAVYLRQAVLGIAATKQLDASSTSHALDYLNKAAAAGSSMEPTELPKQSLRNYLAPTDFEFDPLLDRLSEKVLATPNRSGKELLLLAVLLKLDGQGDRAKLFADEVRAQVANSESFAWHDLLRSLESNNLVAAQ